MTQTSSLSRTTQVISVSLPPRLFNLLEKLRDKYQQTRSSFISSLIQRYSEEERWTKIYKLGEKTRRRFNIASEEDIDRILHEK